jgi:predicted dehydrogenase
VVQTAVLVGCGAMAKGWLKALAETPDLQGAVKIVGLVDLSRAAAEALAAEFSLPDAVIGTVLEDVLNRTGPDLVFDVVIPAARRGVVATALAQGCHVLSEKPMASSIDEARELVALAAGAGRVHAVVQNRRFVPAVRRIRALLESGALGEVSGLYCDFFVGAHFGGFREQMDHVLLLDMAIHTFDAARYMIGRPAEAVYCYETNPQGSWWQAGATAQAIFEFQGGVPFVYRGSWCAEGANTSWEGSWRITGSKGTLLWDGAEGLTAHAVAGDTGFFRPLVELAVPPVPDPARVSGHASVIRDFLAATSSGHQPETAGSDNIRSLAMVFGAIDSAERGQRVAIPNMDEAA